MNLTELNNFIKTLSLAYPTVRNYGEGDVYEALNSGNNEYPTIFLTISEISTNEDITNITATLFYIDRLLDDNSNRLNIQTVGTNALKAILEKATEWSRINLETITYTPFTEKFADLCAGVFAQFSIQINDELDCGSYESVTLTIKEDGVYSTLGYEQVIVDVTKVRSIDGHSGDITLGKGLTINDDNVLSGVNPTFEQGENITITHTATEDGDNYKFDVPDMRYDDSIGAFNGREKLNKYLYSIEYNTIDYNKALEHFSTYTGEGFGHCSLLRKGNLFGRNYDWTINKQVEFALKTNASGRLYSVMGIATAAAFTTDIMESNTYIKDYLYLPFRLVDGINEKGLVCNVNELPVNVDSTKNIAVEGNTPEIQERESIPMIMLVRYILDRFEKPIEAADYIKNYVNVKPIIGEDGEPMNFHFCIADRYNTVYLYFYGNSCNYEVKNTGEDFVMTNFRLADTNLVDGHYSTTGSNIEGFGQGVERANALIDFDGNNLLDYLYGTVNFTKAYTTTNRLTDFAGIDGVTIDNEEGLRAIQSDAAALYSQEVEDGTLRTDADLWQTVHSVVYDLSDKSIKMKVQEIEGYNEVFSFNPYPRVEIEFTPDTIVPSTTNFVEGTTYSIYNALQRITNLFAGYWNYIKTNITDLIPSTASSTNQLADKSFVNETVAQNAANFRGNWGTWSDVPTDGNLYPVDYAGNRTPTNNDYMVVTDASGYDTDYDGSWRFLYTGDWTTLGKSGWSPAYRIGSAFTDAQQAAIDSTITSDKVNTYDSYESRIGAVETDKRDRIYTANKVYATDAEGKDIALDLATIQEHNYASLTNKPTINGVEIVGDKTSHDYNIQTFTAQNSKSGISIPLKANELVIAEASLNTTLTIDHTDDVQGAVNEYRIQIKALAAGRTLTFPDGLTWSYPFPTYMVNGMTYEISIINNCATYVAF